MKSLFQHLKQLCQTDILLRAGSKELSVNDLLTLATNFRNQHFLLKNSSVTISCDNIIDFLISIIALDDWANEIFLASPSIDISKLCAELQSCWLIRNSQLSELSSSHTHKTKSATKWWLATSGTTDAPKLFGHTLESLTKTTKAAKPAHPLSWGLVYDFNRFAGLQVVLQAILSGSKLVSAENVSHSERANLLLAGKATAISATPSLWRSLLMEKSLHALELKQITIGGEIVDQPLLNLLSTTYPKARIVHIYASTEAGVGFSVKDKLSGFPASWLNNSEAPIQMKVDKNNHLRILPNFYPDGSSFKQRLDRDGYFDTEDLVTVRGDRVYFLGRASGAINVGGNKVIPEEIEQIILEVPGVKAARVSGKSSSILGQLVIAEVVADHNATAEVLKNEILKHCRTRLQQFKVPTAITFVDNLSATSTGKLERTFQ